MATYNIVGTTPAVPTDVNQILNILGGTHDVGIISLASQVANPTTSGFSLATQNGTHLGVGTYQYKFVYVTGQYKDDNVTIVVTGYTLPTPALSITTTSGVTNVQVTMPTSLPSTVVAINVCRTSVGGSDFRLLATVKAGTTYYVDSVPDANRSSAGLPISNTTGTMIDAENPYFRLNVTSSQNITTANADQLITFGSGQVPISSGFTTGSNVITCNVDGIYKIHCAMQLSGLNSNILATVKVNVTISGTTTSYFRTIRGATGWDGSNGGGVWIDYDDLFALPVGATLQFYANVAEIRTVMGLLVNASKISKDISTAS